MNGNKKKKIFGTLFILGLFLSPIFFEPQPSFARDFLKINHDGEEVILRGDLVVEAKNGDVLFRDNDGQLWKVASKDIKDTAKDDKPFIGLTMESAEKKLLAEFDAKFSVHTTARYVICYNTTEAYARWVGALYERLHRNFMNFWTNHGFEMHAPDTPLTILVFDSRESYNIYSKRSIGVEPTGMDAYYNVETNRVVMYDLTGADRVSAIGARTNAAQINAILAKPEAAAMVATIIHEATHQMACNTGLHQRFANYPFWVSEGIAMYFESPQLKKRTAWRGPIAENRLRLIPMRHYLNERPVDSIQEMVIRDNGFREEKATSVYSESWALVQYLMRKRKNEFFKYLKLLSEKKALVEYTEEERLKDFKDHFGEDLAHFDKQFLGYVRSLKY